jgi:prepilin-type N-terminal cleavage/methylation domain-containing protein
MKKRNGYSLIEFLVAIAVFLIIAGIVLIRMDTSRKVGRDTVRVKDIGELSNALEKYYTKEGTYPDDLDSLTPDFIGEVPQDPINEDPYIYDYCKDDGKYALIAKLETENQALKTDYDKDWPDTGTPCDCNPSTETEDLEDSDPYTYCVKNP